MLAIPAGDHPSVSVGTGRHSPIARGRKNATVVTMLLIAMIWSNVKRSLNTPEERCQDGRLLPEADSKK